MSVQKIEADLRAFTDSFVNLVRAARVGDDTTISKKSKAPGDLVEVLAEKMLLAAQDLFQTTAELKRRAFLASVGKQLARAERAQTLVDLQARVASLELEIAKAEEGQRQDALLSLMFDTCLNVTQELRRKGKQPARSKDGDLQSQDLQLLYRLAQDLQGS